MSHQNDPKLVEYRHPDCDIVSFEINHFPAPLEWDGSRSLLSWAQSSNLAEEEIPKWDAVLTEMQQMIIKASAAHFPAEDAVIKGLKPGAWDTPGNFKLYEVRALISALPLEVMGEPLVVRNLQVVKRYTQMMPEGAVW